LDRPQLHSWKEKNPLLPKEPEKPNKFIPLNCSKGTPEGIQPGPNKVKKSTLSPEGGLVRHPCGGFSFSLSSGKGKKKEDPSNPARPVKFEDYFTGVNPACPACPVASENGTRVAPADGTGVKNKVLAEKTIEDVLLHFSDTVKVARRRYRQFACAVKSKSCVTMQGKVTSWRYRLLPEEELRKTYFTGIKKGIDHGTRPELQGGGLVRSAGGNRAGLLGRKNEEREKGDERILGSGDFISNIVQESDNKLQKRTISPPSLKKLIGETAHHFDVSLQALVSRSRNRQVSKTRAVISYLAVNEVGYTQEEVSNHLNISRIGVRNSLGRGEKMVDICEKYGKKSPKLRLLWFLIPRPLAAGLPIRNGSRACPGV